MKKAFTLIELLVVIAIIAILAAILFPVFAQAKIAAKKTQSISNIKQIGTGVNLYMADYDDTVPIHAYEMIGFLPANLRQRHWPENVQPYIKNWQMFRDPMMLNDPLQVWGGGPENIRWWYNWMRWPAYGMNVEYLNPAPGTCATWGAQFGPGFLSFGPPVSATSFGSPSGTVFATTTKIVGTNIGAFVSNRVGAPASITDPNVCTFSNWGWGTGTAGDTVGSYPGNPTYTGYFAIEYGRRGNVTFLDSSTRNMAPGQLAAGTNWRTPIANTAVQIVDRSQYLWDNE